MIILNKVNDDIQEETKVPKKNYIGGYIVPMAVAAVFVLFFIFGAACAFFALIAGIIYLICIPKHLLLTSRLEKACIIFGYIGFFAAGGFLMGVTFATSHPVGRVGLEISCRSNLKRIGIALRMYASEYDGFFPPEDGVAGLNRLLNKGDCRSDSFICPTTVYGKKRKEQKKITTLTDAECSYRYFGGHKESDPPGTIIVCDKPNNHDKFGNVLFLSGLTKGYVGENWLKKASRQPLP